MASILSTGMSALNAFQRQLATTGHNISNSATEGYNRQRVDLETRTPEKNGGAGYVGTGVNVAGINRVYDEFLADRVRNHNASTEEFTIIHERAAMIDSVIADPDAGVSPLLQNFFNALQDVADDPTSVPAREVLLNDASVLSDRFQYLDNWMSELRSQTNTDIVNAVDSINTIAQGVADVNQRIVETGSLSSTPPNDLLDQRDELVNKLSDYLSVSTTMQRDGTMNVFVGNGQALVVGPTVNKFVVNNSVTAGDVKEVAIEQPGLADAVITDQLRGGQLGGLMEFNSQILDSTQNSLGLVAIGLGDFFNEEHLTGLDLDGDLGKEFFAVADPELQSAISNSGTVSIAFDNIANLTNQDYELRFDGVSWSLTDAANGNAVAMSGAGTVANPFVVNGVSIEVGAGAAAGDVYLLRPTRSGAQSIDVLIGDARDVAAADVMIAADSGSNAGTGHISEGALTSRVGDTRLAAPITMTFDAALNQFNLSNGATLSYNPATDSGSTLSVTLAGLGDFDFSMNGTPANGDTFTLSDNAGGVGDNRNALRLAAMRDQDLLLGGTASIADANGYIVADVGTRTSQAQTNAKVQSQLLGQAEEAYEAVSGVNLDEEAANLVRFQQAYQAAAQVINVSNTLFDSLLGAVRR